VGAGLFPASDDADDRPEKRDRGGPDQADGEEVKERPIKRLHVILFPMKRDAPRQAQDYNAEQGQGDHEGDRLQPERGDGGMFFQARGLVAKFTTAGVAIMSENSVQQIAQPGFQRV
jgi:hypothetical protein